MRPWRISDSDYIMDNSHTIDTRKTIFVGGVPRPLKAIELAEIMNEKYGNVCYAGIDIDTELKYPKGADSMICVSVQTLKLFFLPVRGCTCHLLISSQFHQCCVSEIRSNHLWRCG